MVTKENNLTIRLSPELYRKLKAISSEKGYSIKDFITKIVNESYDILFKKEGVELTDKQDEVWNNFMKSWFEAPEEEPDELDMEIIKRAEAEIARGEEEDFEEAFREMMDES